jgi:hypothetical protein
VKHRAVSFNGGMLPSARRGGESGRVNRGLFCIPDSVFTKNITPWRDVFGRACALEEYNLSHNLTNDI